MHLVAYVRDYNGMTKEIEDDDYKTKKQFKQDLECNEYEVLSIFDNKDLYVLDHSDFGNMAQLRKEIKMYKDFYQDCLNRGNTEEYADRCYGDKLKELTDLYAEANSQSL